MMTFLSKYSTKGNIIIGILSILFINLVAFPNFPKVFFGENLSFLTILDTQFGFSSEFVTNLFLSLNENGRTAYKYSTIFVDFPYPIIYSITYSLIFIKIFEKNKIERFKNFALMPLGILFFDVLENLGIIHLINNFPNLNDKSIYLVSIFNQTKWLFALASLILLMVLMIITLRKKLNQR